MEKVTVTDRHRSVVNAIVTWLSNDAEWRDSLKLEDWEHCAELIAEEFPDIKGLPGWMRPLTPDEYDEHIENCRKLDEIEKQQEESKIADSTCSVCIAGTYSDGGGTYLIFESDNIEEEWRNVDLFKFCPRCGEKLDANILG